MRTNSFLSESELPPRPDPTTGVPRPPQAPKYSKPKKPAKERDKDRITDPSKAPQPPEGQGPVLAWYKPSQRQKWIVGGGSFFLIVIGVTLMQGFDLRWMNFWWIWLIVLVGALLIAGTIRGSECSAGAEWFQRKGGGWVRLYELKKVTAQHRSNATHVDMEDRHGGVVMISLSDLHEDREIWDLVYNGILHSVVAGDAETNGRLHSALGVPRPWPEQ